MMVVVDGETLLFGKFCGESLVGGGKISYGTNRTGRSTGQI